jgi:hypothetical protein
LLEARDNLMTVGEGAYLLTTAVGMRRKMGAWVEAASIEDAGHRHRTRMRTAATWWMRFEFRVLICAFLSMRRGCQRRATGRGNGGKKWRKYSQVCSQAGDVLFDRS